jgi:hypothetical protein
MVDIARHPLCGSELLTQQKFRRVGAALQLPRITKSYQFLPPRLVRAQCFTLALLDALRQN